jgi:hypothetical protein
VRNPGGDAEGDLERIPEYINAAVEVQDDVARRLEVLT